MEVRRGKLDPKKRLYKTQRDLYYWHVVLLAMYENCNKMDRAISDLAAKISSNSPANHRDPGRHGEQSFSTLCHYTGHYLQLNLTATVSLYIVP